MPNVERALISVSDKSGLADFAKGLTDQNIQIDTTAGTLGFLLKSGLEPYQVNPISTHEYLKGKIKTLHPKIFIAILANRKSKKEMLEVKKLWHEKHTFDLVVVNLYQDKIDVGGAALIRAAAKNYKYVACVTSPNDYKPVLTELRENKNIVSLETFSNLAVHALDYLSESDRKAITLLNKP
jgi:phosphoribosylaminoimidazolecarboxamide formyltransferase/IMP cyclohydrolase